MGACYKDSMNNIYEIAWFSTLELDMETSIVKKEGLISIDKEFNTRSCYVELHRKASQFLLTVLKMQSMNSAQFSLLFS